MRLASGIRTFALFFHFFAYVVLDTNHEFYQRRDKISDENVTEQLESDVEITNRVLR